MSIPSQVTVIGSGISGTATAAYCAGKGADVLLSDTVSLNLVSQRVAEAGLTGLIRFEGDGHSEEVYKTDLMVVSPGVPLTAEIFSECRKRGVKIIGEVELAFSESSADFIAVTGSAGKSTTVSLINSVLKSSGCEVALCGNIGTPAVSVAPAVSDDGVALVEVSSFQLETIDTFAPSIGVILNLAPNHLDRHGSLEEYYGAKFEIARSMKNSLLVLNGTQQELLDFGKAQCENNRVLFFGAIVKGFESVVEEDGFVVFYDEAGNRRCYGSLKHLRLAGEHNIMNALASAAVVRERGVASEEFEEGLSRFTGLAHRMELVGSNKGITYYNDSKATTPESMAVALNSFNDNSVVLIAGGKDKGGDFNEITPLIKEKCRVTILIGTSAELLYELWYPSTVVMMASSLQDAVIQAQAAAVSGNSILLSPGCASFDMFSSFKDRGDQYKALVKGVIDA